MKIRSVCGEVLSSLFMFGEWYMTAFINPRKALYYGYEEFLERQDCVDRWVAKRALRDLQKAKKIKILKKKDRILIKLESAGKISWLKEKIKLQDDILPAGMKCLVLFDIPEELSKIRRVFRNDLKACGFQFLQRSAWVTDKAVISDVKKWVKITKLNKYVSISLIQEIL